MHVRSTALFLLLAGSACAPGPHGATSAGSPAAVTTPAITEADLRQRLFTIAHDSMMGRETGSRGAYLTAEYVAREFKRLGLEPAGENGTWFQTVPFWIVKADPQSKLSAGSTPLVFGRDFLPQSAYAMPKSLDGVSSVYGGSYADTTTWIATADAAGKVVVLDLPAGASLRGRSLGSRFRGASAVLLAVLDNVGSENVAVLREGRPVSDTTRNAALMPTAWITRAAMQKIFSNGAVSPGAAGAPISGWFDFARAPVPFPARNVVAVLRGSDPTLRNQYVALTAHNDHVGFDRAPVDHDSLRAFNRIVRPMGADSPMRQPTADEAKQIRTLLDSLRRVHPARLDSIRNGADDDGSGTVGLLEIAEAMARPGARPKRSLLFVNHTAEEAGLLGSRWFTDHPTVPLDSVVAEIDQDMTGRGWPDDVPSPQGVHATRTYLEVIGAKRISREFGDTVEAANARQPLPFKFDYSYDAPGHPLQYYCRADHYSYARYGIPSLAMSRGEHLDYHQVTDEPQYINYPDLARVTHMVYDAASALGNMSHRPKRDVEKPKDPHSQCRQ